EAVAAASQCSLLVWDGDDYEETSFTRLIPQYLRSRDNGRVVAFRIGDSLESFSQSWREVASAHPGRMAVVPVDPENLMDRLRRYEEELKDMPPARQRYVMLGRLAIEASGAKQVVALGGGSISQKEAELSCGEDIFWTVFALSRGKPEQAPTLMDWAAANPKIAKLVGGQDPEQKLGFFTDSGKEWSEQHKVPQSPRGSARPG
ncbi:MGAT4C, partial [Symbiodinium pilosum]